MIFDLFDFTLVFCFRGFALPGPGPPLFLCSLTVTVLWHIDADSELTMRRHSGWQGRKQPAAAGHK